MSKWEFRELKPEATENCLLFIQCPDNSSYVHVISLQYVIPCFKLFCTLFIVTIAINKKTVANLCHYCYKLISHTVFPNNNYVPHFKVRRYAQSWTEDPMHQSPPSDLLYTAIIYNRLTWNISPNSHMQLFLWCTWPSCPTLTKQLASGCSFPIISVLK